MSAKSGAEEKASTHMVLLPRSTVNGTASCSLKIIQVYHPRQDSTILLVQGQNIYELQKTQIAKYASWFLDQRVLSNKQMLMGTPIDPRFILLPYFEVAGSRYSPLEQIVHSSNITTPSNVKVLPLQHWRQWKMDEVFDVNDKLGDDMIVFRYNKDKTLAWLQRKVEKVSKVLALQRKRVQQTAQPLFAESFRSGSSFQQQHQHHQKNFSVEDTVIEDQDRRVALEITCDLLSDSLISELVPVFGYTVDEIMVTKSASTLKRKAEWEIALEQEIEEGERNAVFKGKGSAVQPVVSNKVEATAPASGSSDYSAYLKIEQTNAPSQPSAKVSKTISLNAAAAKGTKSISSFFGVKK